MAIVHRTANFTNKLARHFIPGYAPASAVGKMVYQNRGAIKGAYKWATSKSAYSSKKGQKALNFRSKKEHGDDGHGVTNSRTVQSKKPTKNEIALRAALPQVNKYTSDSILISSEGRQNFSEICSVWYQSQLQSFCASAVTQEKRFFVQSGAFKNVLTNFTSTPCNMEIFDIQCKKNVYGSDSSSNMVANGLNARYNTTDQATIPWQSPMESEEFRSYWKVIGVKTIILNPGETHVHDFSFKIDRYYTSNQDIGLTQPNYQRGMTHAVLVRTLGTPVKETGASTKISYAVTKVGCINHFTLRYKTPTQPSGNILTAAQASKPQTGLITENYMDEDTGIANQSATV